MDLQSAKLDVMQKIINVRTPSIIEKINEILNREMIVGYTTSGDSLTGDMYNARLEEAERQIEDGNFTNQEDLENEAENW